MKSEKAKNPASEKPGKPAGEARIPVAFRLPEPVIQQLDTMAARRGLDRSALLFQLVERALIGATVEEIAARAIDKIESAGTSNDAILAFLEDLSERLAAVEQALKK